MTVRMIHPLLPGQVKDDVHESAVPHLVTSGWQVVTDEPAAAPSPAQHPSAGTFPIAAKTVKAKGGNK